MDRVHVPSQHISRCAFKPHLTHRSCFRTLSHIQRALVDNRRYHPRRTVQSSTGGFISFVVLIGISLSGSAFLYRKSTLPQPGTGNSSLRDTLGVESLEIMANHALPGRPGNLTTDQELKLQEMWTATFKVFGIAAVGELADGDTASIQGSESLEQAEKRSRAETSDVDKKKRKRHVGLFSRKHDDNMTNYDVQGDAIADGADKYGQAKEFHKVPESQSAENLRSAFWSMVKHDDPDGLLLRFLRARKWNVQSALIMLIATLRWRVQEMHVDDDIIKRGEAGAFEDSVSSNAAVQKEARDFLTQLRLGKSFLRGTDREGRPMCFVRVRLHKQGEQSETSLERYTVYTIETARFLLSTNVDTAAVVFDMTDFSMANMDYGPVKFMIKCFEANYPESLGVVLVHKSPWIFHSIWKIIKGWLDPVVASKVHFTKNVEELEEFIERSHIIKELGGDDPWTYDYVEPIEGENNPLAQDATRTRLLEERAELVKDYEIATQQWTGNPTSREKLRQRRAELAERLRVGYWELDRFVRARTLYDRIGTIRHGPLNNVTAFNMQNICLPAAHQSEDLD